ncbi:hypothetical protein OG909_02770 [Streptomyces sp. NBC_01754]|uniref:hypothetical protein n=1 Tax=Streptomyces sp. NBC_01754 TaxID=2975930 RepID=UPI002DDABC54|nr:hypothetical protein [Streptomyces sp. NBC_01754]WSC91305.1 hypothetical protein OG909_02770 [Streptomyces sp. NBC_01754]
MREVGRVTEGDRAPGSGRKAAVFAPAGCLTGVEVAERSPGRTRYRMGRVPEEPAEGWESVTVDITDAYGERTHVTPSRDELRQERAEPARRVLRRP